MNTFTVLFLCIQACLIQNVVSQCLGKYGPGIAPAASLAPIGYAGYGELAYPAAGWNGAYGCGVDAYGGVGEGNVAVAGELPVAGTTAVTGQVPIMGAVRFGGDVCAAGAVTISGKCGCGCGLPETPYWY